MKRWLRKIFAHSQAKAPKVSQVTKTSGVSGWPQEKVVSPAPRGGAREDLSRVPGVLGTGCVFHFMALVLTACSQTTPGKGVRPGRPPPLGTNLGLGPG